MSETTAFSNLLRAARRNARLSQRDVAEGADINHTYVSKLENGRLPPASRKTIRRLAEVCETDPEPLLKAAGKSEWPQDGESLAELAEALGWTRLSYGQDWLMGLPPGGGQVLVDMPMDALELARFTAERLVPKKTYA